MSRLSRSCFIAALGWDARLTNTNSEKQRCHQVRSVLNEVARRKVPLFSPEPGKRHLPPKIRLRCNGKFLLKWRVNSLGDAESL